MAKSRKITSFILGFLMIAFIGVAVILTGCGDKKASSLTIELADSNKTAYSPGEVVNFNITADGEFDSSKVELSVTSGENEVTIMGLSVKIDEDALPGQTITVFAKYEDLTSNSLSFSVAHIEATEIDVIIEKDVIYSSEIIDLKAFYLPANATRQLEFKIVEGQDKAEIIEGNKLSINANINSGDKIKVVACMGEVYSAPYEIEVTRLEESMLAGILFEDQAIEIDSTTDNLKQNIFVKAYLLNGDDINEIYTNLATLSVVEGEETIKITNNYTIEALNKGTAVVQATYKNFKENLSVTVYMTPDQVKLPENFNDNADYRYEKEKGISFAPQIINSHNSEDLKMVVKGTKNIVYTSKDGVWTTEDASTEVTYDGENLTIKDVGEYNIYFESISGCEVEVKSPEVKLTINQGVNVSTKEEFLKIADNSVKEINLTSDIIFANGSEIIKCYGDKILNGNGFTIDLSGQLKEKDFDYGDNCFIEFINADQTSPYKVEIRDVELVGNMGLFGTKEFAEYKGVSESEVQEALKKIENGDYFRDTFYRYAIGIKAKNVNQEIPGPYAYAIPVVENISIRNFNSGIRFEYAIDEIETGDPNGRPAVNGLKVSNLFGDGVGFMASRINLTNYNIGAVGGTPISSSQTGNTEAGINRDEKTSLNIYGDVVCDNISDGTSLYITSQMMSTAGIANVFNGGLSSIIQTVITLKGQELLAPYIGTAEQDKYFNTIEDAKSNIIRKLNGINQFNLFCFSRNGTEDIYFDEKLEGLIVDLDDKLFYNGIDTTHKFIRVSVYDVLMGIKSLGGLKDLIMQNENAIKPIQVFVTNFNYQGN